MGHPDVTILSNRGPLSFERTPTGEVTSVRGGGGLVSSLAPLVEGSGTTWIAAAMSDDDRAVAGRGLTKVDGFRLRLIDIDPDTYRAAYDTISNSTLWFLHHGLWDLPRRPRFDRRWREAWDGYRAFNQQLAEAVAEEAPDGGTVLVQDYHLALVGSWLAKARPDLRTVHFSHTPFCSPDELRTLPDDAAHELIAGMTSFAACGFHTQRWADRFSACAREVLGASHPTFVSPLAPDVDDLESVAAGDAAAQEGASVDELVGDRRMILRVDRIELSKNIQRGFLAYEDLLLAHPEWRERVVFAAFTYPSRQSLSEYQAYRIEVEAVAGRINATYGTDTWTPIHLDTNDAFPRSVAALQRYDVLLVNPVRDGLNLVAKEGPILNRRDGVVVLSREAGAFDEIGGSSLNVNPFDIAATSEALHTALTMDAPERAQRAADLRAAARARTPQDWLEEQLAAAR